MTKTLTTIEQKISPIVEKAQALSVTDAKTMEKASLMLSELNQTNDKVTAEKEKVTKPLNEALKAERARWKPLETQLLEAISYLRNAIATYQTQEIKRAREEEAKIAARVAPGKGNLKIETAVAKLEAVERPEAKVSTSAGSVSFREDKILKVIDESLIPDTYWIRTLNEKELLKDLKAGDTIPGAELDIIMVPLNRR